MRSLRQWFAVAHWSVHLYVATLIAVEICYWVVTILYHQPAVPIATMRDGLLCLGACGYGAWRVLGWHPVFLSEYREWLLMTPWDGFAPLPLGPVRLGWKDLATIGVLFVWGSFHPIFAQTWLLLCMLIGYLAVVAVSFQEMRLWGYFYTLVFGLGLALLCWPKFLIATSLAMALYGISLAGTRKALSLLPMENDPIGGKFWQGFARDPRTLASIRWIGWPHDSLAPGQGDRGNSIHWAQGLLISLACGWLLHVGISLAAQVAYEGSREQTASLVQDLQQNADLNAAESRRLAVNAQRHEQASANRGILALATMVLFYAALCTVTWRLSIYCAGYYPPINLWGRICTGRWIVPGYDEVFIAPLSVAAIFLIGVWLIENGHIPVDIGAPLAVAAMVATALNMPPSVIKSKCSSPARLVPPGKSREKSKFVQI